VPGFFRARKIQRSKQEQHTSQNQNEKICQQSTFLTFIIIYSSLSLSLAFVLFLGSIRSFFASFCCVVSLPLFGETRNIIPPKETHRQCFPLHTRFKSETSYQENAYFSLSHLRGALCILFSFLAEDIYTLTFFFFSRCLEIPRERVRVRKSSHRGDDPFF
jgi:hypothetical protein